MTSLISDLTAKELKQFRVWLDSETLRKNETYALVVIRRRKWQELALENKAEVLKLYAQMTRKRVIAYYSEFRNSQELVNRLPYAAEVPKSEWQSFGVYVILSPMDKRLATLDIIKTAADWLRDEQPRKELQSVVLAKLMKNKRPLRRLIDIDSQIPEVEQTIIPKLKIYLKDTIELISKTHGGYHIIYRNSQSFPRLNQVLDFIRNQFKIVIDFSRFAMTPLPGTFQGGKQVRLLETHHYSIRGGHYGEA